MTKKKTTLQVIPTHSKNNGDPVAHGEFYQVRPKCDEKRSKSDLNTYTPRPQQERIKKEYTEGMSIRQIAKQEGKARETITKIVRSIDIASMEEECKQRLRLGMEEVAKQIGPALIRQLKSKNGGRLAFKILDRWGVIPPKQRLCPRCRRLW